MSDKNHAGRDAATDVVDNCPCTCCPVAAFCQEPCALFDRYTTTHSPKKRLAAFDNFKDKLVNLGYVDKPKEKDGYSRSAKADKERDSFTRELNYSRPAGVTGQDDDDAR